jgi:hypothetical protein
VASDSPLLYPCVTARGGSDTFGVSPFRGPRVPAAIDKTCVDTDITVTAPIGGGRAVPGNCALIHWSPTAWISFGGQTHRIGQHSPLRRRC